MNRILLITIAITILASCQQENTTELPKTLDEVEFFYMERTAAQIYHLDPECNENCVYVEKERVSPYLICGKCISKELAREIISRQ